jgi:hypothetical protein
VREGGRPELTSMQRHSNDIFGNVYMHLAPQAKRVLAWLLCCACTCAHVLMLVRLTWCLAKLKCCLKERPGEDRVLHNE